jgi:acetyltransferase-like isoleucine patch superfamily enzyme
MSQSNIFKHLRYHIPLHFVLWLTNFLPDNVIFIRLRGWLSTPFFAKCGKNLGLGRNISFYTSSEIVIGDNVYIAYGCWLAGPLIIEDEVMFGPYCITAPGNHTKLKGSYRYGNNTIGKALIKKGSWLGAHSMLAGDNPVLGKGSVLAANSVLICNGEDHSLYAGSPAKKIKNV